MFSHPKILFLVSLLFVALLNPKFNPYLPFKFLIFYHSSITGDSNGNLRAQIPNPAVCDELLTKILAWKNEGALTDDIITRLRIRTVPSRYVHTIHSWIDGK